MLYKLVSSLGHNACFNSINVIYELKNLLIVILFHVFKCIIIISISHYIVIISQVAEALMFVDNHHTEGLKINAANDHGDTPLHIASRWGFSK